MPGKENVRKRLLYDLSPVPDASRFAEQAKEGKYDLEVRVVYKKTTLLETVPLENSFVIGTDPKLCNYELDDTVFPESGSYRLVSKSGEKAVVSLKDSFKGFVVEGKNKTDINTFVNITGAKTEFEVGPGSFAVVEFGDISFVVVATPREKLIPGSVLERFDAITAVLFFIILGGGFYFFYLVGEVPPIEVDIFEMDNRFAKLIVDSQEEEIKVEDVKEEKKVKLEKPKEGITQANTARKSLGDEGRVGNKKSTVANAQGSARRGLDEKVAQSSGIMGALSSGAASFDRVFGGGGLGAGMEKTLGSVTGISGVDQFGSGGLGTRGFGTGGGGNALGIGGLGSRGRGGGGTGYGMAKGRIGGKGSGNIDAGGGGSVIMGALDRSVIDAYIRRNLAKIRWCYEKELNKNPKLFGKIVVNFIISGSGKVDKSEVKRTTMGNAETEDCVARQIKKIRFPEPKGGGIVIVTYPFVFKNSES